MPKTMPGLEKIKQALAQTSWYSSIDPNKVVVVAGTNGKGTTCAALESLLLDAKQKVGFYSSPHLISTTERIRLNGQSISEENFVKLFEQCSEIIKKFSLSHFEALTFMAGHYYFSPEWGSNPDVVIFEVGLGGTYDATNAFPHKFCGITKLGLDHTNILGSNLVEIAKNKFGIITKKSIVVHHKLPEEVIDLKNKVQKEMNCNWVMAEPYDLEVKHLHGVPHYFMNYNSRKFEINIAGERAAENIMTAICLFQVLGFDSDEHFKALNKISWNGRMQKIQLNNIKCPVYLSGDHNEQGVESLLSILKDFQWKRLHLVAGIGVDKDADTMLLKLSHMRDVDLYLTETPFKGRAIADYPEKYLQKSVFSHPNIETILDKVCEKAAPEDMVLVTGSLYLVGKVLKLYSFEKSNNP
ncbi:hypothetical protein K2P97_13225 [bacterium]|nr:hypothetical protein [bacterium]